MDKFPYYKHTTYTLIYLYFLQRDELCSHILVVQLWLSWKESALIAGDTGDGSGSPGGGYGNPVQYSCLENPMDQGSWQATVHEVTRNQTQLQQLNTHIHSFVLTYKRLIFLHCSKNRIWEVGCVCVFSSVQFSCSVVSDSLQPHELQHSRPPCPSPTPGVHPNPCLLSL